MNKLQASKLSKLARHLEKGKLGHRTFDFSKFHSHCGTSGCAAGELPWVFPDEWSLLCVGETRCLFPLLKNGYLGRNTTFEDLQAFFGLGKLAVRHLFYPTWQSLGRYGGTKLLPDASRYQVARNMRIFIRRWKSKQASA